jgi:hypothetical protein
MFARMRVESRGQPMAVENHPHDSAVIGSEALAKSAADGYGNLLTTSTYVVNPGLLSLS